MRSILLTTKQAARYLELSEVTLKRWRVKKFGPKFVRLGQRKVRYRQEDLEEWIDGQTGLDS
jgi:excisionase family DNA binding protein